MECRNQWCRQAGHFPRDRQDTPPQALVPFRRRRDFLQCTLNEWFLRIYSNLGTRPKSKLRDRLDFGVLFPGKKSRNLSKNSSSSSRKRRVSCIETLRWEVTCGTHHLKLNLSTRVRAKVEIERQSLHCLARLPWQSSVQWGRNRPDIYWCRCVRVL